VTQSKGFTGILGKQLGSGRIRGGSVTSNKDLYDDQQRRRSSRRR
jgi:hypothetical protein